MNTLLRNSLIAGAAFSTGLLTTGTAQAAQLAPGLFDLFNGLVNQEKLEVPEGELEFNEIDPEMLQVLSSDEPIEVFFINEGAFFLNELSYTADDGSSGVVFEEVSSTDSILPEANGALDLGEGTDIGTFAQGTVLDFFITPTNPSNGRTRDPIGTDAASNPNGLQHVIAKSIEIDGDVWTLLGFEDNTSSRSDRDFNDVVFVLKGVGEQPVGPEIPEPTTLLGLLGVAALGATTLRRRDA
ncbi:MAG: DUF4114 domain-containing protein [Cyanobacteria bacterium P01_G01_bin.54]